MLARLSLRYGIMQITLNTMWLVQLLCLTVTALADPENTLSNVTRLHSYQRVRHFRTFETNVERVNASRRLWDLFQRRNQPTERSSSVLLYPSVQKMNSSLARPMRPSVVSSLRDPLTGQMHSNQESVQMSSRRLANPLRMLQTNTVPEFPVRMPRFPPEHSFNMRVILPPDAMLRLLGNQNYVPEFMSYVKPMEAIVYPQGYLTPIRSSELFVDSPERGMIQQQADRHRAGGSDNLLPANLKKRLHTMGYQLWSGDDRTRTVHRFSRPSRGPRSRDELNRSDRPRTKRRTRLRRQVRRALKRLLADYTACPVRYLWRDWGPRFWPRWIKEGQCVNVGNTSCSIPPGMFCNEAEHKDIVLLRYLCFTTWPRSSCNWYRLHFPVLSRCQCGCSARSDKSTTAEVT